MPAAVVAVIGLAVVGVVLGLAWLLTGSGEPMIWVVTAILLVLWLVGLLLRIGQWVNLLLVAAAILLSIEVINERRQSR